MTAGPPATTLQTSIVYFFLLLLSKLNRNTPAFACLQQPAPRRTHSLTRFAELGDIQIEKSTEGHRAVGEGETWDEQREDKDDVEEDTEEERVGFDDYDDDNGIGDVFTVMCRRCMC